eukprot:1969661-Pleurochrysis_carterae.AAC.1
MGADPLCAYDALLAAWMARQEQIPASERRPGGASATPFFTGDDGVSAWTSTTSRRLAKRMAAECGMDPDEFGG